MSAGVEDLEALDEKEQQEREARERANAQVAEASRVAAEMDAMSTMDWGALLAVEPSSRSGAAEQS